MKSVLTPGIWEVSPYKVGMVGVGFDEPKTSVGICQVFGSNPEADTKMISASKEMYDALMIIAHSKAMDSFHTVVQEQIWSAIRKAYYIKD